MIKRCPYCGRDVSDKSSSCVHCGNRLIKCEECGELVAVYSTRCPHCGVDVDVSYKSRDSDTPAPAQAQSEAGPAAQQYGQPAQQYRQPAAQNGLETKHERNLLFEWAQIGKKYRTAATLIRVAMMLVTAILLIAAFVSNKDTLCNNTGFKTMTAPDGSKYFSPNMEQAFDTFCIELEIVLFLFIPELFVFNLVSNFVSYHKCAVWLKQTKADYRGFIKSPLYPDTLSNGSGYTVPDIHVFTYGAALCEDKCLYKKHIIFISIISVLIIVSGVFIFQAGPQLKEVILSSKPEISPFIPLFVVYGVAIIVLMVYACMYCRRGAYIKQLMNIKNS